MQSEPNQVFLLFKKQNLTLTIVAQLVGHLFEKQRVVCRFDSWAGAHA